MTIPMGLAATRNELLRQGMRAGLACAPTLVRRSLRSRIASFPRAQVALRERYRIEEGTPILPWGEEVERSVEAYAAGRAGVVFAYTSGSTARPKKIAFTAERLRRIKRGSWEAAVQAGEVHGVRSPTLFVLAALKRDASLSTLMLDEGAQTPFFEGLVMPSKYLWDRACAPLLERFGPTACRLWLMVLANPAFIYSTNPSTLAVFLERLEDAWHESIGLVRAFLAERSLPPVAGLVASRVASPGWRHRAETAAEASSAPALAAFLDGLRCYACWDGGYVTPFLERIRRFLPAPRYEHVPMYSMSTETVQTQVYYEGARPHFLPLAPGVLYEFLPEGAQDDPAELLGPVDLVPGESYVMVVSDGYGLRRYQTADLFLCAERVRGLPDLRFLRRQGLAYSFTGEKLTGEQVTASFELLRRRFPALREAGVQLTLIPSLRDAPHYRLVLAWPGEVDSTVSLEAIGDAFEEELGAQNAEFITKRESERLGTTRVVPMGYDDLAAALAGDGAARAWETQFKLLPLYSRTWEAAGLPDAAVTT